MRQSTREDDDRASKSMDRLVIIYQTIKQSVSDTHTLLAASLADTPLLFLSSEWIHTQYPRDLARLASPLWLPGGASTTSVSTSCECYKSRTGSTDYVGSMLPLTMVYIL